MKSYVKLETPADIKAKLPELVSSALNANGLRKGVNETTKAIERGEAKLVVVAEDVDPEEIVMHLPVLCTEKKIPIAYIASKKDLGKHAGIKVGTTSVAIVSCGNNENSLKEVVSKLSGISSSAAKEEKTTAKAEEKAETAEKPKKTPKAKKE